MVKADFTRDYYGDLQLQPGADVAEIKKQFKRLALTYHPDRNPGRESEVTAQFQLIQSAHEVLIDPQERAKYDNNRVRGSGRFGGAHTGSSGVRGNPWSDLSSQYPPPPKAPTARRPAQQPSAGAERYKKWEAPKQSAYQAAHEGAGARQKTYEAWESMKTRSQPYGQGGPQTTQGGPSKSTKGPQVPPRAPPTDNSSKPPQARTSYHQTARPTSPPRRSNSTNAFNKKGFVPSTPGGDEPAASKGAYFTARNKSAIPPDLPAREPPPSPRERVNKHPPTSSANSHYDPNTTAYRQVPTPEPRISTPYATQGGEKLNPFETSNINRSKSARESPHRFDSGGFAKNGSDSNLFRDAGLFTPHRSQSTRGPPRPKQQNTSSVEIESDSSDDGPELNARSFGKARSRPKAPNGASASQPAAQASPNTGHRRTPSKISQFRQWYKDNPDAEPPPNGFASDGSPLSSSQPKCDTPKANTDAEPSIFSFNVNEETFQPSNSKRPSVGSFSSSAENISTKFSSKEWDGKFEGAEYFKPDPKAPFPPSRTQSGSRSRGRSPTKPTVDPRHPQARTSESDPVLESPGGTKFSAQEWADTFKPQTFAPPPPRQVPTRKRTGPSIRPTLGGNAAVVDDGETSDEKPLFKGRKTPVTPNAPSPDAMDVDMPPPKNTVPQFIPPTADQTTAPPRSPKRPAGSPSPTDEASLKVNFDYLKIQDLLSTLSIPAPPTPPSLPANLPNTRPSQAAYEDYALRFAKYMTAWDLYNNQFLLHLVARKNQNDVLGAKRWLTEEGLDGYRRGLKEDAMVLGSWKQEREKHDGIIREWVVLREKMRESTGGTGEMGPPPRKKTH